MTCPLNCFLWSVAMDGKNRQIKNSFNTFPAQMTNKTVIIFSNSKAAWLCMVKH